MALLFYYSCGEGVITSYALLDTFAILSPVRCITDHTQPEF